MALGALRVETVGDSGGDVDRRFREPRLRTPAEVMQEVYVVGDGEMLHSISSLPASLSWSEEDVQIMCLRLLVCGSFFILGFWMVLDGFGLNGIGLDWIGFQRLIARIGLDGC